MAHKTGFEIQTSICKHKQNESLFVSHITKIPTTWQNSSSRWGCGLNGSPLVAAIVAIVFFTQVKVILSSFSSSFPYLWKNWVLRQVQTRKCVCLTVLPLQGSKWRMNVWMYDMWMYDVTILHKQRRHKMTFCGTEAIHLNLVVCQGFKGRARDGHPIHSNLWLLWFNTPSLVSLPQFLIRISPLLGQILDSLLSASSPNSPSAPWHSHFHWSVEGFLLQFPAGGVTTTGNVLLKAYIRLHADKVGPPRKRILLCE